MSSCIFGPVASRRLGLSLGVDLVPYKHCTYNCIYCQLGRTTHLTNERKEYIPLSTVIKELTTKLGTYPDYITLSGSGEPTLYTPLDSLITAIKELTNIPLAVLTNGSLLWQPEVRQALMSSDLVCPSLDAGCDETFQKINRPHPEITFETMLQGLIDFRQEYKGQYWLEVFIVQGINTDPVEIERLSGCIKRIMPDRVQVNSATRPTAESFVDAPSKEQLEEIAFRLADHAEVIADFSQVFKRKEVAAHLEVILDLLQRRPCTIADMARGLGLHQNEVIKYVEKLTAEGKITPERQNNRLYYKSLDI
ncbi:MAG: hypothetical protein AMJ79_10265 [Phycisphaerae bacterium SM23_30]|nr:MAG: hypothetical protein AMJ79_10265 [Phycisphaerae bacterium SM23_30]